MFYKSTYQESLSTSEATKEVTLEGVTCGAGGVGGDVGCSVSKKGDEGDRGTMWLCPWAGDGKAG